MTKEEHLQRQINLLFNYIGNVMDVVRTHGSNALRNHLNEVETAAEQAFSSQDAEFKATQTPEGK